MLKAVPSYVFDKIHIQQVEEGNVAPGAEMLLYKGEQIVPVDPPGAMYRKLPGHEKLQLRHNFGKVPEAAWVSEIEREESEKFGDFWAVTVDGKTLAAFHLEVLLNKAAKAAMIAQSALPSQP